MPSDVTDGACLVCEKTFAKRSMSNHLKACLRKEAEQGEAKRNLHKGFHLVVEGTYAPDYWLHLAVEEDACFGDLDTFLRNIWLECCGHMSAFTIGNVDISSGGYGDLSFRLIGDDDEEDDEDREDAVEVTLEPRVISEPKVTPEADLQRLSMSDDPLLRRFGAVLQQMQDEGSPYWREERSMDTPVEQLLRPKLEFKYEYDFGSTTRLKLRVVREMKGEFGEGGIRLLARNEPLDIRCSECGAPAVEVCVGCIWSGEGWLCGKCAPKHECGEEMLLPVTNSPRCGVCGYTGADASCL